MGVIQSEITPEARTFLQLSLKLDDLLEQLLATFVKSYAGATAAVAYMDSAYAFFAVQLMLQDMRLEAGTFDPTTGDRTKFDRDTDRPGLTLKPGRNRPDTDGLDQYDTLDEFFDAYEWTRDPGGGLGGKKKRRGRSPSGGDSPSSRERAILRERDRLRKLIAEILAQLRAIFTDGV